MKTKIVYEDDYIIVADKPAGMAVQTKSMNQTDVESELKKYVKKTNRDADIYVIHRLDQPVSGLCVFAKDAKSAAFLSLQMIDGRLKKGYKCVVVEGEEGASHLLDQKEGTLKNRLIKDGRTNTSRVVEPGDKDYEDGKEAILDYKVIETRSDLFPKRGELEINLHTGRHHQIRVQLSHAGMPIEGDTKYGGKKEEKKDAKAIALRAVRLEFVHPASLDTVTFTC